MATEGLLSHLIVDSHGLRNQFILPTLRYVWTDQLALSTKLTRGRPVLQYVCGNSHEPMPEALRQWVDLTAKMAISFISNGVKSMSLLLDADLATSARYFSRDNPDPKEPPTERKWEGRKAETQKPRGSQ